jgi:hypothetical protein
MAFRYSPKIVTDGLVLCLDAANPRSFVSGSTTWYDLTKNNYNGSLINGPTYSNSYGGSVIFDGIDDYMANINNTLITIDSFTYEIVFRPKSTPGNGPLGGSDILTTTPYFYVDYGGGILRTYHFGSSPQYFNVKTLPINNIYHFICSRNGLVETNMINGVLENGRTLTNNTGNSNGFGLVGGFASLSWYFNCDIFLIRIYSKALSSSEVLQNYNATKSRFGL